MSTRADSPVDPPARPPADSFQAPYPIRPPQEELEAYARRRIESLRRADASQAMHLEMALERALALLAEAEVDDDPA